VKNTGNCSWSQVNLWSPIYSKIVQPIIKQGDVVIDPSDPQSIPIAVPGEEITLVLEFPVNKFPYFSVNNEWILSVNGITLLEQRRFIVDADNWIIVRQVSKTATPTPRKKKGAEPTAGPPPSRPTPTP
jgi:hypothetical protein